MTDMQKHIGDLRVTIKRDTCIGSGNCTKVAPDVFHLDDEALAAFNEQIDESAIDREQLVEACQVCPVQALVATDRSGDQVAP